MAPFGRDNARLRCGGKANNKIRQEQAGQAGCTGGQIEPRPSCSGTRSQQGPAEQTGLAAATARYDPNPDQNQQPQ